MPMYSSRHADSVFLPRRKGTVEVFQVGRVVAPDVDIDHPKFVPVDTRRALRHFFSSFFLLRSGTSPNPCWIWVWYLP